MDCSFNLLGLDPTLSKFLKFSFKVFNFLFNLKIDNSGKINASLKIQIILFYQGSTDGWRFRGGFIEVLVSVYKYQRNNGFIPSQSKLIDLALDLGCPRRVYADTLQCRVYIDPSPWIYVWDSFDIFLSSVLILSFKPSKSINFSISSYRFSWKELGFGKQKRHLKIFKAKSKPKQEVWPEPFGQENSSNRQF